MKNEVELEALVWHPYGTGFREVGERYTATADDADLLVQLKRAKRVTAKAAGSEGAKESAKSATKSAGKAKR